MKKLSVAAERALDTHRETVRARKERSVQRKFIRDRRIDAEKENATLLKRITKLEKEIEAVADLHQDEQSRATAFADDLAKEKNLRKAAELKYDAALEEIVDSRVATEERRKVLDYWLRSFERSSFGRNVAKTRELLGLG